MLPTLFEMPTRILLPAAIVLAMAIVGATAAAQTTTVKAPRSGSVYVSGEPSGVFMRIAGRRVEIVSVSFPCKDDVFGRASLNDFRLKRTDKGYRFNADANGLVGYSDEGPDENGRLHISGRFAVDAKQVRGHIRVRTKRCGDTGHLRWRAKKS